MQGNKLFALVFLTFAASLPLQAAEVELGAALKSRLASIFGEQPDHVSEAPVANMLEVTYGTDLFYVTTDGRYLVKGEMFDLENRRNLTQKRVSAARLEMMGDVKESDMIIYKAKGEEKHVVTVFTDIDCGYCRQLHKGMDEMNELGITIRYLSFPRAGVDSPSYNKAVSVWCADDPNLAMDDAKNRDKVKDLRCADAPVKAQFALGKEVGVSGTPSMVFSDGSLLPGYVPPKRLAEMLDKQKL